MFFASLGILEIVAFVIVFGLVAVLTETERFIWASLSVIVSLVAAHFIVGLNPYSLVRDHLLTSLAYLGGFVVFGVVWSFIKWFSFLMGFRDALKERGVPGSPYYNSYWYRSGVSFRLKPQASENKKRIVSWMVFWPFSLVGTLLNDPVRRLFNFIFNSLKNQYQRLSDHVFRNVKFDTEKKLEADVTPTNNDRS